MYASFTAASRQITNGPRPGQISTAGSSHKIGTCRIKDVRLTKRVASLWATKTPPDVINMHYQTGRVFQRLDLNTSRMREAKNWTGSNHILKFNVLDGVRRWPG